MPSYHRLLVASSKGGVGKSTTALGLALAYARSGKRVLLVDLDFTSRSLDLLMGAENAHVFDFGDVMRGEKVLRAVFRPSADLPELMLLPACSPSVPAEVGKEKDMDPGDAIRETMERILAWDGWDIVICDTGGGLSSAEAVASLFDITLITAEQIRTSIRAAEFAASELASRGAKAMKMVICAFDLSAVRRDKRAGIIEMIDASSLGCVGVVPFDKKLSSVQDRGMLPDPSSPVAVACANIAGRLSGRDVPLFSGMGKLQKKRRFAL